MNRKSLITIVCLMLLFGSTRSAHAVFMILNSGEKVIGFLEEQNTTRVTIREATAEGGKGRERHILRGDIKLLLLAAEPERLEALNRDNPKEYRNYAEEVAAKAEKDPEAREIAIRLYLIAAHLDTDDLGKSCLLGMISLARSPREEKNFRALAYLIDPAHDERVLQRPESASIDPSEIDAAVRGKVIGALKALRRGNLVAARNFTLEPAVRDAFRSFSDEFSFAQFEQAARTGDVPPDLLSKVVSIELSLMGEPADGGGLPPAADGNQRPNWAAIIRAGNLDPIPSLALETITEFEPGECHYRNGQWVRPE